MMSMSVLLSNFFIQPQQIATNKQHSQMSHTPSLATQILEKNYFRKAHDICMTDVTFLLFVDKYLFIQ